MPTKNGVPTGRKMANAKAIVEMPERSMPPEKARYGPKKPI
jgi:hypothetical protein